MLFLLFEYVCAPLNVRLRVFVCVFYLCSYDFGHCVGKFTQLVK